MTDVVEHPLHTLPKFGNGIGLHRVRFLMEACGIDPAGVAERAIAVTGSNGKGSTACIAAELLAGTGEIVGMFTSPHLYRYNERFRIGSKAVEDAALLAAMDRVWNAVGAFRSRHDEPPGAFEAQFVVALAVLEKCRWLVLEAGIGGRYDPVRLARAPVSALVSLDLEHTELLGRTLLEIALDKLDATQTGGVAILGESCLPLSEPIRTYALLRGINIDFVRPETWRDEGVHDGWQQFSLEPALKGLRSRLAGRHQINNHAVACAAVQARLARSGLWPRNGLEGFWRDAIARVIWPGRLETIASDPSVVIDVGHTPEGIRAALAGFRVLSGGRDALLVTGGSKNKHVREMLEILVPEFQRIVCTAAWHNGLAAADIEAHVRAIQPAATTSVCTTIGEAVALARQQTGAVYVAGGLFLAAEFAHAWRGGDPRALRFF